MINALKRILGFKSNLDIKELYLKGAQIIDVRTKGEYHSGHIEGSINIPLNTLENQLSKLKKNIPLITCCASGMRSSAAKNILKSHGFEVYNGGSWISLKNKITPEP